MEIPSADGEILQAESPILSPVLLRSTMLHDFILVTYNSLWFDCEGGVGAKPVLEKDLLNITSDASKTFCFKHWTTNKHHYDIIKKNILKKICTLDNYTSHEHLLM